jgi:hypothetical protein
VFEGEIHLVVSGTAIVDLEALGEGLGEALAEVVGFEVGDELEVGSGVASFASAGTTEVNRNSEKPIIIFCDFI